MSVHEPPQFTPAQVLDAARRAEAEGRIDYAQQFYRHLVDKYPSTSEAAVARSSLGRLGGDPGSLAPAFGAAPLNSPPLAPPGFGAPRMEPEPPSLGNPFDPRQPDPAAWQAQAYPPQYQQPAQAPQQPPSEAVELPYPASSYLLGRMLSRLVAWIGGLHLLIGLGVLPISILNPKGVQSLPALGPILSSPTYGLSLIILGFVLLLVGQVARAMLDQANAAKDMAAIMRAEAESRYVSPVRSRRR